MASKERPNGYWTYERCYEEALKYETKTDFTKGCGGAHSASVKNGWIKEYTWLKRRTHKGEDYWVYTYEDKENRVVYVGLTWRKERHREHKNVKTDTVRLYFESIGKPVPEQNVKMDGLNAEDAQYYEDWYKQKYAEAGWKVLNKAKTGVGTGSLGCSVLKWDYDSCYKEALKYETRWGFGKKCESAYKTALFNDWIKDYTWLKPVNKPNGYWNYDNCYKEALKYETRKAFQKGSGSAYYSARKNGWLNEYTWFKVIIGKWNKETCCEEAKKYKTRKTFQIGSNGAYTASWKNGWLDEFFPKAA